LKTLDHYDAVIVGGGTAGAFAAIAAARSGATTLVIDPNSYIGGNLALGMSLLGASDGEGYWALGGIGRELIDRLLPIGGATPVSLDVQFGSVLGQDPELLKVALLEMAVEAGVQFLFHALVVDAIVEDGSVKGVVVATKAGLRTITAAVTVDCSGDADVLAHAGGDFTLGRPDDHKMQPASRVFRVGNVDLKRMYDYVAEHPEDLKPPPGWTGDDYDVDVLRSTPGVTFEAFGGLIKKARLAGHWSIPRWRMGIYTLPDRPEVGINVTRVHGIDGTDPDDVTKAEVETVLQMAEVMRFLRGYVPGFEDSTLLSAPHQAGIRETRRLRGSYALTKEDVLGGRSFPDQIGRAAYPLDVHDVEAGKGGSMLMPIAKSFGIPLRCLVPQNLGGVVVAGRAISATHEAAGSTRGQATCMVTGHAAGTLAALGARDGGVAQVDIRELQTLLLEQGAVLERDHPIDAIAP
jgi:hypothetical protein